MATVREFFNTEAGDYLNQLGTIVANLNENAANPAELHKVTRALRGSAQMAREERVYRGAVALEAAARAVAAKAVPWQQDIARDVTASIEDLRVLVQATESDDAADARAQKVVDLLQQYARAATRTPPSADAPAEVQFRQYASTEITGIVAELEAGLQALVKDPRNREPLRAIMRRQRALSGAAQLPSLPSVAETLRALEDITRLVARLDVAVKSEWLDAYRSARDVLVAAGSALRNGQNPGPVPALSRVRTLREELLDRYGSGEDGQPDAIGGVPPSSPPMASPPRVEATATATPAKAMTNQTPAANDTNVVPIESLLYSGPAALRRALELRVEVEKAAGANARELVAELFDLIGLALK
jgi:chemotaxis protein histidine kinase CheA